ncbi:unnamed protein product [Hymenolepis diminuta]|uniref:Uncharacterized protein n=1 Tax=Hymenolepis diminuta TaxID=6216 RepID=A0A564Z7F2_HYMDI|nr:unnamed protein product [Hymenolepis diminuta]
MGPDWIDEFILIQFPDENGIWQTPFLVPTNAKNPVKGCNQFLHLAEIPHPSVHIQSSKTDSLRIQL